MPLPLTVIPIPGPGAEDVLVAPDGRVWTGTADGAIHVHDPATHETTTVTATGGRPLGLENLPDGRILVCDAHRGLLALDPATGDLETLLTEVDGERLLFCNNAAVTADGTIWFSDSSRVWPVEEWKNDLIEHTRTGRLFRRTPDGTVTTVLDQLCFANGVALTAEADAVLVAETGTRTIRRVHLSSDGTPGATTTWVDDLPGHPDNIALGSDGLVWVTVASPTDPALSILQKSPQAVRGMVRRLPERLKPKPKQTARVLALDSTGRTVHDLDFDATQLAPRHGRARARRQGLARQPHAAGDRRRRRPAVAEPLAADPLVDHPRPAVVHLAGLLGPLVARPHREPGVTLRLGVDLGDEQPVGVGEGLGVDLRTARDEHLVGRPGQRHGIRERVRALDVGVVPRRVAGDHDGPPPGQRPADRLERARGP